MSRMDNEQIKQMADNYRAVEAGVVSEEHLKTSVRLGVEGEVRTMPEPTVPALPEIIAGMYYDLCYLATMVEELEHELVESETDAFFLEAEMDTYKEQVASLVEICATVAVGKDVKIVIEKE